LCRAANARYVAALRAQAAIYPDPRERVDAGPARAYLAQLRALGVGYRRAAQLAGLDPAVVNDIRMGRKDPIRADTSARILGIRPALAHGQAVPSWRTWRFLDSLRGEGFTKAEIARRLGLRGARIQFKRVGGKVRVDNALKVKGLWKFLMEEDGAVMQIERDE
jgi:hypothetical protein